VVDRTLFPAVDAAIPMTAVDPRRRPRGFLLLVVAGGLLLVGAPSPWFRVAGEAVSGVDHGDGVVTAGIGVAAATAAIAFGWDRYARAGAALGGTLALWVAVETYRRVADLPDHDPAIGLWLTALGALVLLAAAIEGTVRGEPERPVVVLPESADAHGAEEASEQEAAEPPASEQGSGRDPGEGESSSDEPDGERASGSGGEATEHEPEEARGSEATSADPAAERPFADDGEPDCERDRDSGRE